MITLIQFPTVEGIPNLSPFCAKAETLLKMAKLEYQIENQMDPSKGTKGKLPMIRDNGLEIADSELIRLYLEETHSVDFDQHLSPQQKAQAYAFAKMVEERTYWCLVYDRWIVPEHWSHTSQHWFGKMPWPLRTLIPIVAQKQVKGNLHGHGLGRHSQQEIFQLAANDIAMLSTQIGDNDFLMGSQPCAADATVFGFLSNLFLAPLPCHLQRVAEEHSNLKSYVQRCMKLWFPEMLQR